MKSERAKLIGERVAMYKRVDLSVGWKKTSRRKKKKRLLIRGI